MNTPTHWPDAARMWSNLGPPLRPSPEDVREFQRAVNTAAARTNSLRVLILGVTPELHALWYPKGSVVQAADHTQAMIDAIWPGPPGSALLADWTALPLADASIDLVLCDGGVHLLDHPHAQSLLAVSLRRILAPGAEFVARLFVPPTPAESPATVLNDLRAGRVANVHALKLRLGHAMHPAPTSGVRVRDVWNAVRDAVPDWPAFGARMGWSVEHRRTIEVYASSEARYHFVTPDELLNLWGRETWSAQSISTPHAYPLADRCPVIRFQLRS